VSRRLETASGASRADRRREAILDAAARIFAEKGYHETGIADIAGEIGIGHGTVYRYFKNKDDIAAGVSDRAVRRLAEALLQESPTASDTLDEYRAQVERIIDRMFAALDDHPHELRFFHRHLLAVELAVSLTAERGALLSRSLAALFFVISVIFVWRSFYAMRIKVERA